jgi:predicted RNase H-like nuclease (RuvC/YqgF family)
MLSAAGPSKIGVIDTEAVLVEQGMRDLDSKDNEYKSLSNEKRLQIQQLQENLLEQQYGMIKPLFYNYLEYDSLLSKISSLESELSLQRKQSNEDLDQESSEKTTLERKLIDSEALCVYLSAQLLELEEMRKGERAGYENEVYSLRVEGDRRDTEFSHVREGLLAQIGGLETGISIF